MKAYLTYALNKAGDLVHIDSVLNGNECECFCPHCMSELCAKNGGTGEKKVHHFAHQSGADCVGAIESALHKMAKDVMKDALCIQLPDRFDGSRGELLKLDRVEVEFHDKETNLRPDCVGYYGDKVIWIEFKRTHAVDTKKKGKIISAKIDCVELDINECELDPDAVRKFITEETGNRIWIRDTSINTTLTYSSGDNDGNYDCDYCYDNCCIQWRFYAKDENGTLVNLNNGEVNMNEHKYFCLACGEELTIDVNQYGVYHFVHLEDNALCEDFFYMREVAKEIIRHRFITSDKFEVLVPQYQSCEKKDTCALYSPERCQKCVEKIYDLKSLNYCDCLKNVFIQDSKYKCDLVIKHAEDENNDIIIKIKTDDYYVEIEKDDHRIIEIDLEETFLADLQMSPIGAGQAEFHNFKKKTKYVSKMNSSIFRFQLFSSGKSHVDEVLCSNLEKRNKNTVLEYLFVQGINSAYLTRIYSLLKCYEQDRNACFCDICYYFCLDNKICRRYKTKGTPRFPLKELPVGCPHFGLDRRIKDMIETNCYDIQVIEKTFE